MPSAITKKWTRSKADELAVDAGCEFKIKRAEHVREFTQFCRHSKGKWAGKQFEFLDWQWESIIAPLYGWVNKDGKRRYRGCGVWVPKKMGKALALDTPLPTPSGWTTMGAVRVGDTLFDERGEPCKVVAATEVMYERPCYEVVFSDGERVIADAEHGWFTNFRKLHQGKLKPSSFERTLGGKAVYGKGVGDYLYSGVHSTGQIAKTLSGYIGKNHSIPVAGPLELPEQAFDIHPYALGCWLGDGVKFGAIICAGKGKEELRGHLESTGEPVRIVVAGLSMSVGKRGGFKRSSTFKARLRRMGLLGNKHIPRDYLRGSRRQRLDLLCGLMDTDGHCTAKGSCEFVNTNERLARDTLELVRSLGIKPTVKIGRAMLRGKDCGPKYRVRFSPPPGVEVFRLQRKAERQSVSRIMHKLRSQCRHIVAVNPVSSVPVRCIEVNSPSHLFLAGESMIPTHNSTLLAVLMLYGLVGDSEPGAEIYGAARDRKQASIIFNEAAMMVDQSPALSSILDVIRSTRRIVHLGKGSFYEVLSAEAKQSGHGVNAHMVVIDEVHVVPRGLHSTLRYAGASREQPIFFEISTAGNDKLSLGYERYTYAKRVFAGQAQDPQFLAYIAEADSNEVWEEEEQWRKANPSLGVTVSMDSFRADFTQAKQGSEGDRADFKQLRLNLWQDSLFTWLPLEDWDACKADISLDRAKGHPCFGAFDLSNKLDLTAWVLLFLVDDEFWVFPYFWAPREADSKRQKRNLALLRPWGESGHLTLTEGAVTDYDVVEKAIVADVEKYDVKEPAFDPWNATQVVIHLQQKGVEPFEFGQTPRNYNDPMKEFERLVLLRKVKHDGNPVLRHMIACLVARKDANGNYRPDKEHSSDKIDGACAMLMALGRALVNKGDDEWYTPGSLKD